MPHHRRQPRLVLAHRVTRPRDAPRPRRDDEPRARRSTLRSQARADSSAERRATRVRRSPQPANLSFTLQSSLCKLGTMRILRAAHLGMCFGVRDAIALALAHADAGPLTILGDLVHNPTVLSALEAKGIAVAQDVAQVKTPTLMVTAHGTSERTLARTR